MQLLLAWLHLNFQLIREKKLFFSDNGSTAVEVAIKVALQYFFNKGEKKTTIIAFENAYHGDTFGAMSVGSKSAFNAAFENHLFKVEFLPVPNEQNKLVEINFDIFVDAAQDVQPLIDQWKGYLDSKFGASEVNGQQILWAKNKNTRILLENVSTPKDPGIKISFKAAN